MALQGMKRALEDLNIRSLVEKVGTWVACDLRVAFFPPVKLGDDVAAIAMENHLFFDTQ